MTFEAFIPPTELSGLIAAFSVARFEMQRWVRAQLKGEWSGNQFLVSFVLASFNIVSLFSFLFLIAVVWDYGWQPAVTLVIIGFGASMLRAISKRDSLNLWVAGLVGSWVLMVALALHVSWFGLMG